MTDQPKAKKQPREMLAFRVSPAGIAALRQIAADRKKAGRPDCHLSDVARDALADYVIRYQAEQSKPS